jgi:hypothetical protein
MAGRTVALYMESSPALVFYDTRPQMDSARIRSLSVRLFINLGVERRWPMVNARPPVASFRAFVPQAVVSQGGKRGRSSTLVDRMVYRNNLKSDSVQCQGLTRVSG